MAVGIFDECFFGVDPVGVAFEFVDGCWDIVVEVGLFCGVIILLGEFVVFNKALLFGVEVVGEVIDLPALKDCQWLKFVFQFWSWNEAILIFVEMAENCFGFGVEVDISNFL